MSRRSRFILIFLIGAGLLVLLYPTISNQLAKRNHSKVIVEYSITVESLQKQEIETHFAKAHMYNNALDHAEIGDLFNPVSGAAPSEEYLSTLNINGMIGYLDIPSIHVHLPIYHTTSTDVLKKGVGHMSTSAFPVGGKSTHSVLTAHRGLPSAKLFTDLNNLEPGDLFYVNVLDKTLGYQVEQVLVVEPHETGDLQPVRGKDYLTLVTCTPYAINSHRLLVRGNRVSTGQQEIVPPPTLPSPAGQNFLRLGITLPALAYLGTTISTGIRIRSIRRKNKRLPAG